MKCDCTSCKDHLILENLMEFLGIAICYSCSGDGYKVNRKCGCCDPETVVCVECNGNKFVVRDGSFFKDSSSQK